MKNINVRKKLLSLLVAGSIILNPVASLAFGYESGIDLNDDITEYKYYNSEDYEGSKKSQKQIYAELKEKYNYEDWFKVQDPKQVCFSDLLYEDILNNLPPFMLDILRTTKWNIKLVGKGWLYNNWGVTGRGATYYEQRTIAVDSYYRKDLKELYESRKCNQEYLDNTDMVTLNYLAIRSAIFHELGHMLDYNYKYSKKKDWNNIYVEEKGNCNTMSSRYWEGMTSGSYNLKYNYEFWATCFEAYILCRDDLKECCPLAYEYMHNIIYTREKEYELTHPEYDYYHEEEMGLIK